MHLDDSRVRLAAFNWLEEQTAIHGEVLSWKKLIEGFQLDGHRVPLVSMQGIFKPKVLAEFPLTIRTSSDGPYDDHFLDDDVLLYARRGTDPHHPDNVRLRDAITHQIPLIYVHGIVKGRYLAVWPVFIVGEDAGSHMFRVTADERRLAQAARSVDDLRAVSYLPAEEEARRRYATREAKQRLHQQGFRERVLQAYRDQCAICRLRHRELLEAAHIIPDSEPDGRAIVPNGLSLCRLHHGAFDKLLIGIRPDYTVEVRPSILKERDGPMLRHGLQGVHNQRIWTPRSNELRPDPNFLDRRYERYRSAG